MFLIFLVYALFASTFILGRDVVSVVPPIFFIGIRMIIAGLLMIGFIGLKYRKELKFKMKELPWFLGIIIFHIYGAYVTEYISLQYLTGATVCLLYNLSPFITALFAYLVFKECLSVRQWVGLAIGFAAFIPLMLTTISSYEGCAAPTSFLMAYPELILLLSVTCAAIGWIFMKKLTHEHNHSYLIVNTVGMFFGGMLALGHSSLVETWPTTDHLIGNIPFIRGLFGLILIGNIICYNLYGYLLHHYSPTLLSFFGFCTPLFAAFLGKLFLGEAIQPFFFVTIIFVALGLYLFYKDELKLKMFAAK